MSGKIGVTSCMIHEARRILWRSGRLKSEAPGADDLLVEEMLRMALTCPDASYAQARQPMGSMKVRVVLFSKEENAEIVVYVDTETPHMMNELFERLGLVVRDVGSP